jgi:thymidine kinase
MAKVHFFYSTMNAGKSTALLQTNHNFIENNLKTLVFIPNSNEKNNEVISRIGIKHGAISADKDFNFYKYIKLKKSSDLKCILVDEAQFLKAKQVNELAKVADHLNIPVMCYGLRTNFMGETFEGSLRLLSIADNLQELKTICSFCTKKATMAIRVDKKGDVETSGNEIKIGGNELYKPVCRKHFRKITKLF